MEKVEFGQEFSRMRHDVDSRLIVVGVIPILKVDVGRGTVGE